MATFDAASNSGVQNATTGSVTWSHTCAANAKLKVHVAWGLDAFGAPTGVTYAGSAMTAMGAAATVATNYKVRTWYHDSPASGANNVVISVSGPDVIAWAVSATSAGTPTDYNNTGTGSGDPATVTVANAASGDLITDCVLTIASPTVGADQTERLNLGPTANAGFFAAGSTQPGASGGVMSWTQGTADNWCQVGARFPDGAAAAAPVRRNQMTTMGVS